LEKDAELINGDERVERMIGSQPPEMQTSAVWSHSSEEFRLMIPTVFGWLGNQCWQKRVWSSKVDPSVGASRWAALTPFPRKSRNAL
jgi:hypothetical protein